MPYNYINIIKEMYQLLNSRALLLGRNDFQAVLRENFPDLGTELMRKSEWNKIRRLMGKPRRLVNNLLD